MTALAKNGWRVLVRPHGPVFEWMLPADLDEFDREKPRHVTMTRYYHRRMAKLGKVEIKKFSACTPEMWTSVIADLAIIESKSWVNTRGGELKFHDIENKKFWLAALQDRFLSDVSCAWILYYNDDPVSFSFNFDIEKTKYILIGNYDPCVKKHRTGSIF